MSKVARKLTLLFLGLVVLAGSAVWIIASPTAVAQDFLPTAEACGPSTVQSSVGRVNVRGGPGVEFEVIAVLEFLEVRPITGRTSYAGWWQVQLADGNAGWVVSDAVTAQGNLAAVPVVEVALPSGASPAPPWNPTPNPLCGEQAAEVTVVPTEVVESEPATVTTWTAPVNLSQSGSSNEPEVTVEANGQFHILWEDEVDGLVYMQGTELGWSIPISVEVPFGTRSYYPDLNETQPTPLFLPELVADPSGRIHALWIDDLKGLYYSSVAAAEFATFDSWTERQSLAAGALALDVLVDANGTLHLVYVHSMETETEPAGIYYRQLTSGATEWSAPIRIYDSRYFRALPAEDAHVRIAATGHTPTNQLIITWDNRPLGRVFTAHSADSGQTWSAPLLVDGREPEDTAEAVNPSRLVAGALGDHAVLVWQAGHEETTCTQYYRWSADGGATWSERLVFDLPRGCHESDQFLAGPDGLLLLLATVVEVTEAKTYLQAWDGGDWSEPQEQTTLTFFQNPETFLEVTYRCHQAILQNLNTLFVIGCDTGGGKDVWLTKRTLGGVAEWFPPAPLWQTPVLITSSPAQVLSLEMVADGDGLLHAFWVDSAGTAVYYSSRDNANFAWSQPAAILTAPQGSSGDPAVAVDIQSRLLAVWSGTDSSQVYFSWADSSRALTAADWSPAQVVSEPGLVAQSPDIAVSASGTIYISYAVPLNEGRGIYVVRSVDGGETWSPVTQVFDGIAAGWAMVDEPQLTLAGDDVHIVWARYQLPFTGEPLAFFHARSTNGGEVWSSPDLIAEQPVSWGRVMSFGQRTLHRLWYDGTNSSLALWHEYSENSGASWDDATSATGFGEEGGPIWAAVDNIGRQHVLGINGRSLQHWIWADGRWTIDEEAVLSSDLSSEVYALTAAVAADGKLAVVYGTTAEESSLFYTSRALEWPTILPTPLPTWTPTMPPPPTATATPTVQPTPTVPLPTEVPVTNGPLGGGTMDIALSFIPAGLLVVVAFILGIRAVRGRR
jgi:hypothetical protein